MGQQAGQGITPHLVIVEVSQKVTMPGKMQIRQHVPYGSRWEWG